MRMIARRLKEATIKKQTPEMVFVVNREKLFFLYKSNNFFKVLFISVIRPSSETFLCEKSARNNNVSSTRNY